MVVGVEQVRAEVRKGTVRLAVVAHDASRHSREKVVPLLKAKGIDIIEVMSADELGAAFGREQTAAVGITDAGLARGVRAIGLDTGRSE
ncbi:MAG: ribosomal L7Ae/L30e/S12e/Gadd45 family protein [Gemmatimonadota bacterium]